ncbi:hypothetical protein LDENG_00170970 [Lucifuga dentata]|nr:hypothetical protein LDENG_00170970 [Lucifuga dentata]
MPASSGADSLKPSAFIPVCTASCLLIGSTSLFFVFTCPWLAVTISPAVPPCCTILFLFVLANFTMATFMDAGVLPMANEDEDKDDDFRAPLYKNVDVKGVQVRTKCTPSLVVISISGLFLIPVVGLTGFHLHLVSRGRTTNEQVTGKFHGGVNPFTRGCCSNLEYLVCSPISPQYTARPCNKADICVQPPFLKPEIDKQVPVKVSDNGILSQDLWNKLSADISTAGAVEMSDIKRPKTPPPLPPKPDHSLLKSHLAALDETGHHTKLAIPVSIPTVPQLRPVLDAISRGSSPIPPEQLLKTLEQQGMTRSPDLHNESKYSPARGHQQDNQPVQTSTFSSPLQLNSLTLNSRSLTLRHSYRHGKSQLPATHADGFGFNPPTGMFSPSMLPNHSSSLSYDNLINPADPQLLVQRGVPPVGYHPHFMALGSDGSVLQHPPSHSYSPMFMGVARQSPQPRDTSPSLQGLTSREASPSFQGFIQRDLSPVFQGLMPRDLSSQGVTSRDLTPPGLSIRDLTSQSVRDSLQDRGPQGLTPQKAAAVRYDNFSKTIMASIQQRRELEERERMLCLHARSQALYSPDLGIYDIPSRRSLPPDNIRPTGSRGPTPLTYGSQEFLLSTGILGYGGRSSVLSSSSMSSLTRGLKTSSSPLQSSSNLQSKGRSSSPAYSPPDRQTQPLPSATSTLPRMPCSSTSSYGTMKRTSVTCSSEGKDSVSGP